MPSPFDETDFIDRDFQSAQQAGLGGVGSTPAASGAAGGRPPTREELDTRAMETQHRLAELKRAQEALERERVALDEARRRRSELQTGREEMLHSLTRGVALLEEAAFSARRDSEQMGKVLQDFQGALQKIQAIHEETWTEENWNVELTRALTAIENARMEWNAARLRFPLLDGEGKSSGGGAAGLPGGVPFSQLPLVDLCRIGLAMTWPLAAVGLLGLILLLYLSLNR